MRALYLFIDLWTQSRQAPEAPRIRGEELPPIRPGAFARWMATTRDTAPETERQPSMRRQVQVMESARV
jgi:hypothetical protein